jgi:cytochrome c peroxidase
VTRALIKILATLLPATVAAGATLEIQVRDTVNGMPVQPASLRYQTSAGETFSVTRVSYLVSDFALQRDDGSWLENSNSVSWLDSEQNRNSVRVANIPPGEFRSLRFLVGLNSNLNHEAITNFPAGHPLNPTVNGLHWSWQGGFICLALEGLWRNSAGELDGWTYHLARDTNAVSVTLAAPLEITNETKVELDFDLASVLSAPHPLSFAKDGSTTHSRDGDPVSVALVKNLPGAFRVRKISSFNEQQIAAAKPKMLDLPKNFTPYRLQISPMFPIPDLPRDNPLTGEGVTLGSRLFFDLRLSADNSESCATCHNPRLAFSQPGRFSRGVDGDIGTRNAMALENLAWKKSFFWDGRVATLREQVLQPIQNPIEMHETLSNAVAKISADKDYQRLFANAFSSPKITADRIASALEQFLLVQVSCDSKFDHVMAGREKFSAEEQRGFELFSTEYDPRRGQFGADCFHCHGGPLFQSQSFANNGLDSEFKDLGRAKVTGKDSDKGKFAVPSLRNVALTAPYMHDGRFRTLEEVVEYYATGVKRSATLDPNLAKHPDGGVPLSAEDKHALVAFLKTLTDEKYLPPVGTANFAQQ